MDCLFCAIVNGDIPAAVVYRDDDTLAFLDIAPANRGHLLVIPTRHVEQFHQADPQTLQSLFNTVVKVSKAVRKVVDPEGYNIFSNNGKIAGQVIPHLHFHLVPRNPGDGIAFHLKQAKADPQELSNLAGELAAALNGG